MTYRTDLTERLLWIPLRLLARPHSRQELAREFRVNPKTISHDIDALTRIYPVDERREGREVVYSFGGGYKFVAPNFTPEELVTLLLAQEAVTDVGLAAAGAPFAAHAESLMRKVRGALPILVRKRMDALAAVYGSASVPAKNFAPHAAAVERLTTAALECRRVRMDYHSLNTDLTGERLVEPYAIYFDPDGATLKLVAYDHTHAEPRLFSVDHIRAVRLTDERFERPPDFNLRQYLTDNCFNGIYGPPITVRLRAHGVTARIFAERTFHASQRVVASTSRAPGRPETITIELRVAGGRGLVRFILSWVPDVEVLSPPALRQEVADALRQALQQHADPPGIKFSPRA
jgi:predicted DNA-binding transcriptional regulator YafY